jgi:hypothetical protein
MLGADDYTADLADLYGWINRALPGEELEAFVQRLAHRIAAFPAAGHTAIKQRVNAISLASAGDFRIDSDQFGESARTPEAQRLFAAALNAGFQRRDTELDLGHWLGGLHTAGPNDMPGQK